MEQKPTVKVIIDDKEVIVPVGINLIQACEAADVEVPRFCYHDRLKIAGNCRMCLVEVINPKGPPKPVASCAVEVSDGMIVSTKSEMVTKARKGVMEFLLVNHPLDCPICDQAGECDLQDQSYVYGKDHSRYSEHKRAVEDKNMGSLIRTNMTRCIHCTRCVRFMEDVAGTAEIGAFGRGEHMEVATFLEQNISSELSGNIIDLCPVGALTSKPYSYRARSWELEKVNTIDAMDAVGSNIRVDVRGFEVMRILPQINDEINEEWISDVTRFSYDGLKYQRLDSAYFEGDVISLESATQKAAELLQSVKPSEIAVIAGDLIDVETAFMAKMLINKVNIENYECIQDNAKINTNNRQNYIFNTKIVNIPEADVILLIGTNPRLEAPIINLKIRQAFLNGAKIYSVGNVGDLTYMYEVLPDNALLDIYNQKQIVSEVLINAKKPVMIVGQEAICGQNGDAVMTSCLALAQKFFIKPDWNGYNMLHKVAGRVGALDVGLSKTGINNILSKCQKNEIKVVLAIGSDEIDISSLGDTKIIYLGTHGDKIANIANIILPGSCYTEKEATFINTEGRLQKTNQAVPKLGSAKHDAEILAIILKLISKDWIFTKYSEIASQVKFDIKNVNSNYTCCDCIVPTASSDIQKLYFANYVSRSSATMSKRIIELGAK